MFGGDINRSVLSDKAFQSYSFVIHSLFHLFTSSIISPMFALSYTISAFILYYVSTLTSKQLSAKSFSNIIVLLCTAERERMRALVRAWWEHWLGLILSLFKVWFKVYHVDLTHLYHLGRSSLWQQLTSGSH